MRTSTGCRSCRFRHKKCDLGKPTCAGCQRNQLLCAWDDELASLEDQQYNHEWASLGAIVRKNNPHIALSPIPSLRGTKSQSLYAHFVHCTSDAVSTRDVSANPFLQILLPLARHYDMVLEAVLALSGAHCLQKGYQDYAHITWSHYTHALRQVKYGLTRVVERRDFATPLTICTLLFAFIEVVRGDTDGNAFHHLRGTRYLLGAIPRVHLDAASSHIYGFILEWYSYLLSLSTLCDTQPDETITHYSAGIFLELSRIDASSSSGVLCGCAYDLFGMIPHATVLARRIHTERQLQGGISPATQAAREELLGAVRRWQPASAPKDHITAGKIYQLALVALLVSELRSGSPTALQATVDQVVLLLEDLPAESNVTTTLCWPLGILGGFAQTDRAQRVIRAYLSRMTERYGFGNFRQTLGLLDSIWDKKVQPAQTGALTLQLMMETNGYYFILA
ncbi:hypothetical protein FE257_007734 [Aspergillus nanangensis]|uniref:Zn(2)-C6 fungal-type domain-containing protein n=1 Tax=Aspergillus nanangensis TaxID=2582783 RepID=A0AAD4CXC3_ASPNN|nr:hypothetical protein FE257_007734 [Aspergillus nanangensis]